MTALTPATQHTRQLLVIDQNVDGWQDLINNAGIGVSVLILDPLQNGLTQIADAITAYSNLDAIHILSHGNVASLQLGSTTLNSDNLNQYTEQLTTIGNALNETGDLLLYGCNVAQGETGQQFIQALAQITGADVAASDDLTGNVALGGDWVLEASTGAIEADIAISSDAQQNYNHVLGKPTDYELAQMSNLAYSDNPSFGDWSVTKYSYISSGFFAVKFEKGDDIVIAFRGTNGVLDVPADLAIVGQNFPFANWDTQFDYALNTTKIIRDEAKPNTNIYVTGHSLGGALAQVTSKMFGFDGVTFDAGGALNIANSLQFAIKASVLGITPAVMPNSFTNYTVNDSMVSGYSGDMVNGHQIPLENGTFTTFFLDSAATIIPGFGDDIILQAWRTILLHSMDGIEALMKSRDRGNESSYLAQGKDTITAGFTASGDINSPIVSSAQSQTEFYSSQNNPYVFANDLDNIIYGYAGNDAIYSLAGNDTVYGGDGNDTISTAQGNDVIDAGRGNDTVYAGSGDDTIEEGVLAISEWDVVDGGAGIDTLSVDFSGANNSSLVWGYNTNVPDGVTSYSSVSAIQTVLAKVADTGTLFLYAYQFGGVGEFHNIEHYDITATNYNDLLIYMGGKRYLGRDGTDTFYADWSATTNAITWNNDPTVAVTLEDANIAGMERLLIKTGSGDDTIRNTKFATDDYLDTGSGNDTVEAGRGNDTILTGDGNDTIEEGVLAISEWDVVDGGAGIDTLSVDFSGANNSSLVWGYNTNVPDGVTSYSSVSAIQTVLAKVADTGTLFLYAYQFGGVGEFHNIEHYDITATNYNDLLIYMGGKRYLGRDGTDTFYADWSATTNAITWNNDPTVAVTLEDANIAGMERLLIKTGSGDDTIRNTKFATDDYLDTGSGNDTVEAGRGNDTILTGDGNDTIEEGVLAIYEWDVVDGGAGIDTLSVDFSGANNSILVWGYNNNVPDGVTFNSSVSAIQTVLAKVADSGTLFLYAYRFGGGGEFHNIEHYDVTATNYNDLLIYMGGKRYLGGDGTDTFYADWSATTNTITWNNAPTQTQTVNGITVSGLERLLLMTGSGNDSLSNLNTTTDDYLDSGAGNDNIQSGAGNDTLHGGSGADILQGGDGNDVYLFNIGDGHDQIIDTAGTDRVVLGANITASQIGVSRVGNEIRLAISADDSIRFTENAVGGYAIERIEFQNGTVWTATQIQQNINSTVNHAPALSHPLIDQTIKQQSNNPDAIFSYAVPANSFTDIDGDALTYRASLADGSALPNWLGFDANTRTFSGKTLFASAGTLDIKLTATDSLGASVSDDFKLLVEANHNPTGTPSAVLMAGAEDTPYIVSMADLLVGFSDVDGDSLTVSSLSSSGDLTANFSGWTLNNNGTFIVPILPNYNGMLYLDYDVEDGRGGSIHAVQSVNLVSVNDAPSGTDKTITFNENSTYTFTATDFGFSDVDGNSLLAVNISSLPLAGGLKLNGVAVIGNTSISIADINSGKFTYSPAVNTNGANYASFSFQVQDDGGTANGGLDLDGSANTLSFNVVAIAPMTIVGSAGSDVLIGGAANDILNGGIGADVMKGGAGNDIYYVDNAGDSVVEGNAEGVDTVYSTLVYSLADNVENLVLMENAVGISGSPVGAYGNALNNQLTGNSADNFFIGGAGNDTLDGGVSDVYNPGVVDILVGGAGDDTFVARGFYGAGNYAGGDGSDWLDFSQPDAYTAGRRNAERAGVKVDLMVGTAATYYFNAINFTWTDASGQIALASIENIRGTAQGDSLNGNGDANVIDGGAGSDVINGGAGDDILDAGVSDIYNLGVIDLLNGGTGNDIFLSRGFYGAGKYMGGDGLDWLDFSQSDTYTDGRRNVEGAGIKVDLTAGVAFTYYQAVKNFTWVDANGKIALATIENIRGTDQGDSLSGDINANVLEGGAGNDVLNSGAGDDVLNGGIGNDVLNGGAGADDMRGGVGNDTLDGGASDVYNPSVIDTLNGDAGNDTFLVRGFYGAGNYNGGADTDLLDFSQSDTYTAGRRNAERAGVKVDLMVGTAATYYFNAINFTWTDASGQIALASIENIRGTAQGDSLNGNGDANVIDGGAGSDVINGGAGDDILDAGVSDIYNLGVIDTLNGGAGDDNFLSRGFYGAGIYDGGTGNDTLDFSQADAYTAARRSAENAGVSVDLSTGKASTYYLSATNFTWTDANGQIAVIHIENVTGTAQGDKLIGDANANVFEGGNGSDILAGGAGKDLYLLQESVAATDTLKIATGDSLIDNYDIANSFGLGTGTANTIAVDKLDLSFTSIAANVSHVNGTDFGNVGSHSISNGLISFANVIGDTPLSITAANLTDAINYVQAAITGNNTVAFISDGNTFVFQDGGVTDTLVELVGVMANSVNNSGLGVGAVWIA